MRIVGIDPSTPVRTRSEWSDLLMPRLHPDDAQRLISELREHPDDHTQGHEGDYRVQHADGRYRWVRFRGMSVRNATGRPIRWAGSLSDIDAEKRTEEALRRSEERYQLAVAGANEGLWDWDLASDSLFLSARAQELLWLEPGEPQRPRREWIALSQYHPDDQPVVRAALAAHLRGRTQSFKVEFRLMHHSGEFRWYRQRASRCATRRAGRPAWPARWRTSPTARTSRPSASGWKRSCARRRRWRRSARWPAASRTTSTTSWPASW
jgi:PAS domain-containing protein